MCTILFKLTKEHAKVTGHERAVSDDLSYVLKRKITSMSDIADVSDRALLAALIACVPVLEDVLSLSQYRVIRLDDEVQVLPNRESS